MSGVFVVQEKKKHIRETLISKTKNRRKVEARKKFIQNFGVCPVRIVDDRAKRRRQGYLIKLGR